MLATTRNSNSMDAALLVRKGVLTQEEIDSEMDRLYDQMENFEQQ